MSGDLVFLIYPDADFVESLSKALHTSGLKVLSMRSEAEAEQVIATFKYVLPDVLITPLDAPDSNDNILIKLLNANPLMEQVPVVVLASGALAQSDFLVEGLEQFKKGNYLAAESSFQQSLKQG